MTNLANKAGAAIERSAIITFIRARSISVHALHVAGRLTESEAAHVSRCLNTLADDIAAGLHSEGA